MAPDEFASWLEWSWSNGSKVFVATPDMSALEINNAIITKAVEVTCLWASCTDEVVVIRASPASWQNGLLLTPGASCSDKPRSRHSYIAELKNFSCQVTGKKGKKQ